MSVALGAQTGPSHGTSSALGTFALWEALASEAIAPSSASFGGEVWNLLSAVLASASAWGPQLHTAGGQGWPPPQLASHHESVAVGTSALQVSSAWGDEASPTLEARAGGEWAWSWSWPSAQVHVPAGHRPAAQLATHQVWRSASPLTLVQPVRALLASTATLPSLVEIPMDALLRAISASICAISASISASEVASDTTSLASPSRLWCWPPPAFFGRCARRALASLLSSAVALALAAAALPLCGPLEEAPHAALEKGASLAAVACALAFASLASFARWAADLTPAALASLASLARWAADLTPAAAAGDAFLLAAEADLAADLAAAAFWLSLVVVDRAEGFFAAASFARWAADLTPAAVDAVSVCARLAARRACACLAACLPPAGLSRALAARLAPLSWLTSVAAAVFALCGPLPEAPQATLWKSVVFLAFSSEAAAAAPTLLVAAPPLVTAPLLAAAPLLLLALAAATFFAPSR
mmetsp:Transcript_57031/g.137114  ORF Transcript_57031/g.137114 Transcript_57031/m.137114 type:complete len:475 (+) Transcript_57031:1310-2734(+)